MLNGCNLTHLIVNRQINDLVQPSAVWSIYNNVERNSLSICTIKRNREYCFVNTKGRTRSPCCRRNKTQAKIQDVHKLVAVYSNFYGFFNNLSAGSKVVLE